MIYNQECKDMDLVQFSPQVHYRKVLIYILFQKANDLNLNLNIVKLKFKINY